MFKFLDFEHLSKENQIEDEVSLMRIFIERTIESIDSALSDQEKGILEFSDCHGNVYSFRAWLEMELSMFEVVFPKYSLDDPEQVEFMQGIVREYVNENRILLSSEFLHGCMFIQGLIDRMFFKFPNLLPRDS